MSNKNQIRIIQTLLSKCKLRAQKEDIVLGFSDNRTTHVSELKYPEAKELIYYLQQLANDPDNPNIATEVRKANKMKRKIISMAHEMRWNLPLTPSKGGGGTAKQRIDMKRVDGWCKKYSYLHKPLDSYTYKELPKLITQFEQGPYKHFISNL